jgi:hypothetical protein
MRATASKAAPPQAEPSGTGSHFLWQMFPELRLGILSHDWADPPGIFVPDLQSWKPSRPNSISAGRRSEHFADFE